MSVQSIVLALAIIVIGTAQYTLVYQAIRDLMRRPRVRGGNKSSWALLILCVPIFGALAYGWLGPTSFLQKRSVPQPPTPARELDPIVQYTTAPLEPRPDNVTPLRPRQSDAISGRMPAQRPGLTRSRAHNTSGNVSRIRRPGA